jgi:hypothetical protein
MYFTKVPNVPFHFCANKNGTQKMAGNTKRYCPQYQHLAAPEQRKRSRLITQLKKRD